MGRLGRGEGLAIGGAVVNGCEELGGDRVGDVDAALREPHAALVDDYQPRRGELVDLAAEQVPRVTTGAGGKGVKLDAAVESQHQHGELACAPVGRERLD